jgi:hypothetical protein
MDISYFNEKNNSLPTDRTDALAVSSPSTLFGGALPRSAALSNKLTTVLSSSYADLDIRDALGILDDRKIKNSAETRRQLRLDVQREIIECNGEIIREFGEVANVGLSHMRVVKSLIQNSAIEAHWVFNREFAKMLRRNARANIGC